MIDWMYPVELPLPPISPVRLVCNVRGYWVHYPAYTSDDEYRDARTSLVGAALDAVVRNEDSSSVVILMQPLGAAWIEWLLPMEGWDVGDKPNPGWDPSLIDYARLFSSGVLSPTYRGPCAATNVRAALQYCADMVIKNLAPESWLFVNRNTEVAVYFHNTSSIGLHIPNSVSTEDVVCSIRGPDIECQLSADS